MSDTVGLIADLSHFETSVNFSAMKAGGIAAVILKASQGTTFTDPAFASYTAAAKAAGLLVGAYHYFDPAAAPDAQASYFLGIAGAAGVSVTAVDFEPATAGAGEEHAAAMCLALQQSTGRWPLLYTGKWSVAPANPIFSKCPLWLAEWTTAATPNLPPGFTTWELWQFESVLNAVPGVAGACSRSRVNGGLADLQAWWGGAQPPTDTVIDTIIDSSGNTNQIIHRVISAASSSISGATVAAFLALALLGCCHHNNTTNPQVAHGFDWSASTFYLDHDLRPVELQRLHVRGSNR